MELRPLSFVSLALLAAVAGAAPQYRIFDLGVAPGFTSGSQGNRVTAGGVVVGRSLGTSAQGGNRAFAWTADGGMTVLPTLVTTSPTHPYAVANGASDGGTVVGSVASTTFGSGVLPVSWQGGVVTALALPAGRTAGAAFDVNASGLTVGYVNGGSASQRAAILRTGGSTEITATTAGGAVMTIAYGVNDAGLVAGQGTDPGNAARSVGLVYDTASGTMTDVGALPGLNSALPFDVSENGLVVGASMMNQGAGVPFVWSAAGGMRAIPLPVGTTQGSARGVNSLGWAVGTASSAFAIPFVFDGTATYRIADVVTNPTGWDLSTNTSSSALGINDGGMIAGTAVFNGVVHAYALVPVPEPGALAGLGLGTLVLLRRRRR